MNVLPGEQLRETLRGFLWPFVFMFLMCLALNLQREERLSGHARRPHLYVGRLHGFSLFVSRTGFSSGKILLEVWLVFQFSSSNHKTAFQN